jgi:hypothetical protein
VQLGTSPQPFRRNISPSSSAQSKPSRKSEIYWLTLRSSRRKRYVPPKRQWSSTKLQGVTTQQIVIFVITNVKSSNTVAYLLKARTMEPQKQPLLANGSETTFVPKQRFGKHVPATTDKHATIEVLLETVSTQSVKTGYKEENLGKRVSSVREAVKK